MQAIQPQQVQSRLEILTGRPVFIHLEMTTGSYAAHHDSSKLTAAAFIRNASIEYSHARIEGAGPFRVGLKMSGGWVYAEGLTHWEPDEADRLLLAGHDGEGRLVVALELSEKPFE